MYCFSQLVIRPVLGECLFYQDTDPGKINGAASCSCLRDLNTTYIFITYLQNLLHRLLLKYTLQFLF